MKGRGKGTLKARGGGTGRLGWEAGFYASVLRT